jgi:hypothetical protein
MGEFNVNKTDGSLEQTAGMPSEYPATQVMLSDGVTNVEDKLEDKATVTLSATNSTLEATVKNGILFIFFDIKVSTANTWDSPFSDTLPAGYRPNRGIYVPALAADLKVANVFINNDGTIQIKGASTATFTGCASYYI